MSGTVNSALAAVEQWLDGEGSEWARRTPARRAERGLEWTIDLDNPSWPIRSIALQVPHDFPERTCQLFVDKDYFLKVPHIEENGHVCLGLRSDPADHDNPIGAVCRTLETLQHELLEHAADPDWCARQFHGERASYWMQACRMREKRGDRRPVARSTLADLGGLSTWSQGPMVAYVSPNEDRKPARLQLATCSATAPQEIAARHGWAGGTEVHGQALFVRLSDAELWTPTTWPQSFTQLETLVARATSNEVLLTDWVALAEGFRIARPLKPGNKSRKPKRFGTLPSLFRPVVVFLVLGSTVFGYQLFAPGLTHGGAPRIEPIPVERIDANWALARDQELPTLHARRAKRVLLLGGGSLGSPLFAAIAKSGIGALDIVDKETFDTENVARHYLGIGARGRWKANELAARMRADVPGLEVRAYNEDAVTWCRKNCRPGTYDLIVECTAESTVRSFMARRRPELFGDSPIIHAWVEPLCSAGHVVLTQAAVPWPADDPANERVNASDLSTDSTRIALPGCGSGFHPYGVADVCLIAAFAAERVVSVLDNPSQPSTVWTLVRASAFFERLGLPINLTSIVPNSNSPADSVTVTRPLADVLHPHD